MTFQGCCQLCFYSKYTVVNSMPVPLFILMIDSQACTAFPKYRVLPNKIAMTVGLSVMSSPAPWTLCVYRYNGINQSDT